MDNELDKKIEDLQKQIEELKSILSNQSIILEQHTHKGNDGSSFIYNDSIVLKPGQQFKTGNFSIEEVTGDVLGSFLQRGHLVIGDDKTSSDGFDDAQLTLENQPTTNGSTNQTFFYGLRGKAFVGSDGVINSGSSTFTTNEKSFPVNSLVGATILVFDGANAGQFDGFTIVSNLAQSITISGTWTFSGNGCTFMIFVPVYFGSAQYPWRRLYTTDGTAGGIRFGLGDTNGGQNGLLYMDSAGDLYWRPKTGAAVKLN